MGFKEVAIPIEKNQYQFNPDVVNQVINSQTMRSHAEAIGANPNLAPSLSHILPSVTVGEPLQNKPPKDVPPNTLSHLPELFKEHGQCITQSNTDDKGYGGTRLPRTNVFGEPIEEHQYDKGLPQKPAEDFPGLAQPKQVGKGHEF